MIQEHETRGLLRKIKKRKKNRGIWKNLSAKHCEEVDEAEEQRPKGKNGNENKENFVENRENKTAM